MRTVTSRHAANQELLMKIVCDACAAKYSIADDKVKGKVFKIRCKKCSNIIVVRGTAGVVEEPAVGPYDQKETRVYDYGSQDAGAPARADEAVWHVVIDQEQVGPLSVADDVGQRAVIVTGHEQPSDLCHLEKSTMQTAIQHHHRATSASATSASATSANAGCED